MSRRQIRNRAQRFARAIELETLEVRQLLSAAPDLIPSGVSLTANTINWNDADHADFTVTNQGNAATTSSWQDYVYATPNSTYVPGDSSNILLGQSYDQAGGPLAPGGSYTQDIQFSTYNLSHGTYHIFIVANGDGGENDESNTANNASIDNVALTVHQVDLTVTNVGVTSGVVSEGQNDTVNWTVQNIGDAPAQAPDAANWYDAAVATTDSTFDPNSPNNKYLGFPGNPNGLDINASYTQSSQFNTYGWAAGTYNIFVIANDGKWFQESNFNNNVSTTPTTLTVNVPDLSVNLNNVAPTTAPSAGLGEQLTVDWKVTNSAAAQASTQIGWTDVVWISPHPTLDTTDPSSIAIGYFGNPNTSPLQPGDSYDNVQQVSVPTNIAPGSYYIFIQTDQFTSQYDSNSSNNVSAAFPLQVTAADLVVSSAQADNRTHNVGDTIPITWTVTNQGNAEAEGAYGGDDWHDAVYWSYSPTFDDNAHWVGDMDYSNKLAPGASYAAPQELDVNTNNWDGGQYYFFVKTDWYGWQEPESNENNNVSAAIPVTLNTGALPDLTVALNSTGAPSAFVGSSVEVNFTVQNSPAAGAPTDTNTWWEAVWLSKTPTLIQGDSPVIGYFWNGNISSGSLPLNQGQSYTQDVNVTIPSNLGTGQYYLIVTTDVFSNVQESNGANNVSNSIPIEVDGSDLQLTDFQVNDNDANVGYTPDIGEIATGAPFTVQWNVSNQGNAATQNTYSDAIYLSKSSTFDPANSQLLYYSTEPNGGPLDAGDSYQGNATLSLTHLPLGAGTYYLFAVTDAFGDEPEGNEDNNVSAPIQFEVSGPDLAITNAVVNNNGVSSDPNTVLLNQTFNVSWEVDNFTDQSVNNPWNDSIYISRSSAFDPSTATLILSFSPDPSLGAGNSYTTGYDFSLSSYEYGTGQYYIFVVTDDGNQVAESNESNNIAILPITVQGPDLVVTSASISPTETSVGSSVSLSYTVQNQGETDASNGWNDEFFASTSPVFDPQTAIDLGSAYQGSDVSAGSSYTNTGITLDVSQLKDGGTYYLFVVTDNNNSQPEDNENNNVSAPILLTLDSTPTADLTPVIDTSNTDSTVDVGNYFNAQWKDNNIGTASTNTSQWTDNLWLSPTSSFDPSTAIRLGSVNVGGGGAESVISPSGMNPISANPIIVGEPAIDSGDNDTISTSFLMPEGVGFGTFYLFVQTDVNDNVYETTNTNNISPGVPINVLGSDLTVTASLDAPPASATAPDGSTVYVGGLTGYYYGTGSNGANNIATAETYITNNNPLAQFVASQIQYPAFYGAGSTDDDTDTLRNFLGSDAGTLDNQAVKSNQLSGQIMEFDGYVFLPAGNTTLFVGSDDGAELFINGNTTTPFIADTGPHPFTWESNTFDAPTAGLYAVKIVYYEDQGGTGVGFAWNDPSNGNMVTIPSADLYSSTSPIVITNQQFTVDWTGTNNGNASPQNSWNDAVYISDSPVFDRSTATFLGNQYINADDLNIGGSYNDSLDVSIPGYVGGGLKYLFVSIDDNDNQPEAFENNNISAPISIIVGYPNADLEPTSFVAPYSATLGEQMQGQLTWSVTNNGSVNANGDWNDQIYLSKNPWLDSSSVLLNEYDAFNNGWPVVGSYGGGYSTDQSGSITIPLNIAPGGYYIILAVDGDGGQGESNSTNNDLVRPIQILPPNDDLQITDATVNGTDLVNPSSPPVLALGQEADLTMTVTNVGTADATNNWVDAVYLSTDGQVDSSDILLGFFDNGNLPAGESYTTPLFSEGNFTVFIPSNLNPGNYYLLFVTDTNNSQPETDEDNNVFVAPITLAGPDLVVTAVSAQPLSGNIGDQFVANWTVKNQGEGPATHSDWYDAVYVSTSPTFDYSTAIYVGSQYNYSGLNAGDSYNQSMTFTMPGGLGGVGTVYVYVITDSGNFVPETVEDNNISAPFAVNITGGPDLQVQNFAVNSITPLPPVVNGSVVVSWSDVNNGTTPANAPFWYDGIYISSSSTFDRSQAIFIGELYISSSSLAPGASLAESATGNIPSYLAAGNYYLYVYTDLTNINNFSYGYQAETDENNNASAPIPITVNRADLAITSANVDTTALAEGQATGVEWTIKNTDPTYSVAGGWSDSVYISNTPNLSGSYVAFLTSTYAGANSPLGPGASYVLDNNVTLPTGVLAGNYYLVFATDVSNNVGETNENNNLVAIPITVSNPDLTVTSVAAAPNPVAISDNLTVTWTVQNLNSTPAYGPWYDSVWLSQDGQIDFNSIALGNFYADGSAGDPVLQGNGIYTETQSFTVPTWVAEGSYTVIVKTDGGYAYNYYNYGTETYNSEIFSNNLVAESNENNNIGTTTVRVGQPDLTVENAAAPVSANAGDTIPVSFTVANLDGTVSAKAQWYDGVYYSTTPTINGSNSTLLTTWLHDGTTPVTPGGSYDVSGTVTIPEGAAPGSGYLIFVTDIYGQQTESNENNNTEALPIAISAPDLTVINGSVPTQGIIGSNIAISWTTQNIGAKQAVGPWWDNVYISTDGNLDSQSTYLGQVYAGNQTTLPLAAGAGYNSLINATIPSSYPDGPAKIFIVADYYSNQAETNENNNVASFPINIGSPDLVVSSASAPSVAVQGKSMNVSFTVANNGTSTAPNAWYDRISISPDTNPADAVYTVDLLSAGNLAAGHSYSVSNYSLSIPETVATGSYHVLVTTDYYNQQAERNESNNTTDAGVVSVTAVDLTITAAVAGETSGGTSGGLTAYYYGTGSGGAGSVANARAYIASHSPLAQFVASQVQYPAGQGIGASDSDGDTFGNFLGSDANSLDNQAVKSNGLSGQIIEFDGFISLPAGNTTLWMGSDDGSELFLNGSTTPFINDDGSHGFAWASGTYDAPAAGLYAVKIVYFEGSVQTGVGLAWGDTAADRTTIPEGDLFSAVSTLVAGNSVDVSWTVSNHGTTTALDSWTDRVSISPDDNPADAVYSVDVPNAGNLAAGSSYSVDNFVLNLPSNLPQGVYHVLVTTDANNAQPETDEDNNTSDGGLISVDSTDLTVTNPSGPALAVIGSPAAITWTTKNDGNFPANGPWVDNVYVSPDGQFSDAMLIGQYFTTSLPAGTLPLATGGQYTVTDNITIPTSLPIGSYTVFIETDAYNQIPETNESNNIASFTMQVGAPHLTITAASADTSAGIGTNMNVSFTVNNDGTSVAPNNWKDTVYLTPDGNIADAVFHADFAHTGGLANGASYTDNEQLSIPLSLATGNYQVIIVTDSANAQPETNENNNSFNAGNVQIIAPDLTITTASAPATGSPGGIAAISYTVKNIGNGATITNWFDEVYFNSSPSLAGATFLASFNTPTMPLGAGASYVQTPGLAIPTGAASGTNYFIIVTDYGNNVTESNETNNTYTVPITVAPVSASIGDVSMAEGNSGFTEMTFTVTLSAPTGTTTSVSYTTANGTAINGSDYNGVSSTLIFAPGVTTQQISVPVLGDQFVEDDETFAVNLFNPVGMSLSRSSATGTILNDDFGGTIEFDSATYSTPEGNSGSHNVTITVDRTGGSAAGVSVPYSVTAGTATAGNDFDTTTGTLNFAANQSSATFNVLIYGDTVYESDETINLSLGAPTTTIAPADSTAVATLGSPSTSVLTILNDDAEPAITISNVSANEGNAGFTPFTFNITLSNTSQSPITVNYATADNTATVADNDYQAASGTLTFAPGTSSQSITVEVVGDTTQESDETFFVNLTSPSGATLSNAQGIGTIVNDDSDTAPTIVSLQNISGLRKGGIIASADFNLSKPGKISDPSTWASNFITLTLNGASVDTSSLTIVSDDSNGDYTINGLGALTTTPGLYVLTLNASAVTDDQGVHGVGTASDTFTIDTAPSVSIDNASQSGGVGIYTDSGSFSDPDGPVGDSWTATVDYGDGSGPVPLTLSGMNFSLSHDYTGAGNFTATVVVTDSVGETGSDTEQFNIVNAPTITSLSSIPTVVTGGVSSVNVTFSQPIDITTLKNAVTLRRGGISISDNSITIADDGGNTYTINGLAPLTSAFGAYVLSIDATQVQNTVGVSGTGSASDAWQEDTAPFITSAAFNGTAIPTNTLSSGAVQFTDPDPSPPDSWTGTINFGDGTFVVALTPGSGQAFTFSHAYANSGIYTAVIRVTDEYGLSDQEIISVDVQDRPTITSLQSISGLQPSAISSVNFSLSKPGSISDPSTWAANFISLRRGGASVSTSSLSIVSDDSNGDYTINGLGALTDVPGQYVLTLDASAVTDIYGIQGTGTASDTWTRDTAPSVFVTNSTVTGGVGITLSDTGSFTDPDNQGGDFWTATVNYGDGTAPQALALNGNNFTLSHSFASAGDYTATVIVTDSVGETGNVQAAFDVVNGPTIISLQSISGVLTAGVPSVDVTFSQPIDISTLNSSDITLRRNNASISTASVSIKSDGGNTYTISGLSALTSAFGAYQLAINAGGVQNLDGVAGSGSATDQWQEDTVPTISNVAVNSNYIAFGSSLTGTMTFTDPDPSPTDSWTGTVNYGEGNPDQPLVLNSGQSFDFNHVYNTPGVYAVTLTVTDGFGESAVASFDVHVELQPTITDLQNIPSPQTGGVPSVSVTFSQPINIATLNSSDIILRRGGVSMDTSSLSISSAGGDTYIINDLGPLTAAFGSYTLTINAAGVQNLDGVSGTGSATDSWQEDSAPLATFTKGAFSGVEGSVFSDTGSFIDPDFSPPDAWTATINYDDGTGAHPLTLSGNNFSFSHAFSTYGVHNVAVTVTDAYGLSSTATDVVTVTQTPVTITMPADTKVNINTPLSFNGTAVDPNAGDPPFTLSVDYGDGTGAHALTVKNGLFTFTPDYSQAGRYTVVVTATDQDGTISSNSMLIRAVPNTRPIVVNDGLVERSKVSSVTVSFDDNVNVTPSSFTVLNTKTNAAVPYTIQQIDGKTYKLLFTTLDAGGSIADGHYSVTVNSANVTDVDGDTLIADVTQTFYRRFGDMYGNGYVTLADLTLIQSLVGKNSANDPNWATDSMLDFNGNGSIDSTDVQQLATRYGIKTY